MYTARKRLKLFHKSLCQYISHCDLLTHLDISDTVSKSKLYNLLEAISETHDAMNDQGSADGYDVESVHLSVFCFNLSIGVKNSRIKMNRKLISHDF